MRLFQVLAVVGVGLPLAAAIRPPFLNQCSVEAALKYFTCSRYVSPLCVQDLKAQAVEFCEDFLAAEPVTTTLTTVTPIESFTVTETSITSTTTTELTTTTETSTTWSTSFTTTDVTSTTIAPFPAVTEKKRGVQPICSSLVSENLIHHPASRLSRACSCLGVTATTSTVTVSAVTASPSTVFVTSTTVSTLILSSTETSTATSVETSVSGTTVTSTALATFTPPAYCQNPPLSGIFSAGQGNSFQPAVFAATPTECCIKCYMALNCVGAGFNLNGQECFLLVKTARQEGTGSSEQCPLGFDNTSSLSPPDEGNVEGAFAGPCRL
ncbi:hypothetical protein QBC34DRAFT_418646 [Podospora aff. communis PSN243]|uniref:Apple domain-containing protein n=1 Tax=Podospora aff. communis PSN243 TaxID=3040156 RepID=A0AAV9G4R7_9PEZI|nr:hypothetical protein QBC34DRAFT_418646 [Podospora aff. communis PSN243]